MSTNINLIFAKRTLNAFGGIDSQSAIDYVHPLRQNDLRKILSNVPESVDLIIVYGSSLGDFLRDDSDLDLAIVSKDPQCYSQSVIKSLELDSEMDVKVFPSIENLLEQAEGFFPAAVEIVKRGLPVYFQGSEVILI